MSVLLQVEDLRVEFPVRALGWGRPSRLRALDQIDFGVAAREALGVVGESGSGKSTLARALLELVRPSAGRILWQGVALGALPRAARFDLRRDMQIVFQSPSASLDPRMSVAALIAEPLHVHQRQLSAAHTEQAVAAALASVELDRALSCASCASACWCCTSGA